MSTNPATKVFKTIRKKAIEEQMTLFKEEGVPKTPPHTSPLNNYIARSSIFSPAATTRGNGRFCERELMYADKNVRLTYIGREMPIVAQDVFLYCTVLAQGIPLMENQIDENRDDLVVSKKITINLKDLANDIGLKKGGTNYESIKLAFEALSTATLIMELPDAEYKQTFHLLGGLEQDNKSGQYTFHIPPNTLALFLDQSFGYINMKRRRSLKKQKPLAKWLQGYLVSSSKDVHKIKVSTLQEKTKYSTMRPRDFRKNLMIAFEELKRVGEIEWFTYDPESETISWQRTKYSKTPNTLTNRKTSLKTPQSIRVKEADIVQVNDN